MSTGPALVSCVRLALPGAQMKSIFRLPGSSGRTRGWGEPSLNSEKWKEMRGGRWEPASGSICTPLLLDPLQAAAPWRGPGNRQAFPRNCLQLIVSLGGRGRTGPGLVARGQRPGRPGAHAKTSGGPAPPPQVGGSVHTCHRTPLHPLPPLQAEARVLRQVRPPGCPQPLC